MASVGLGKAARLPAHRQLVSSREALKRVCAKHPSSSLCSVKPKLPKHIEPYAEYMLQRKGRPITDRDIAKAYVVTRSSIQRQALSKPRVCKAYPGYKPLPRAADPGKVRPEDVMAQLLFSPAGEKYLNAAQHGHYDAESARVLADRFSCFGLVYPRAGRDLTKASVLKKNRALFENDLKRGARLASRGESVRKALRLPPDQYYQWMRKNVFGVGASKVGFFASLLGRGDIPTFDAREIKLWQKGGKKKLEPTWADVARLKKRFETFPMEIPEKYEPFRAHLVHHALWDAYDEGRKPSKTTHGTIIRAMQFAGTKKRKR